MAYNIKRGGEQKAPGTSIKDMLVRVAKRLLVALIIMVLIGGIAYFGLLVVYNNVPVFAEAANDVLGWLSSFYQDYGIWATLGLILFIAAAVWALSEEARRRERRREMTKDIMR